ncbi:MAG: RsmB/NOP family class I SAM-dependent RNA methyltransferase [Bacteroidetes bacterium]|nr:RsmB/NOP family class I SAM-dependent RNA methyltransferase [Bacteroidota bacterium]
MKSNSIKLFPPLLKIVSDIILEIDQTKRPIDKSLQPVLKNKQLGSRDRRFIIEQTYDIIRNKRFINRILECWNLPNDTPHQILVNLLRNGVTIINPELISPGFQFTKQDLEKIDVTVAELNSFPDWMEAQGQKEYGADWPTIAQSLNEPAMIYLRPNTLLISLEKLQNKLKSEGIATEKKEKSLCLINRENLKNHPLYLKGYFEIQDWASQQVALNANIHEGQLVVDACAGAGGKSLHLAALLQKTGRIIASDFNAHRLKQLQYRMKRAQAHDIEILAYDQLKQFKGKVDRLILDVPCSATGTIRRKPEIKWNVTEKIFKSYITAQQEILIQQAVLVAPEGLLIYATCSIFKAESEDQIQWFLSQNSNFELMEEHRFLPHLNQCDGFYIGILKRTE